MDIKHIPVLLNETLTYLNCRKNGIYVDATLGHGNHALALLEKYPDIKLLVGIDQDIEALERSQIKLRSYSGKTILHHGNFSQLETILADIGIPQIDGILFDLGVSTAQLMDSARGFSFNSDGPLDMRMDKRTPTQAKDLIQKLDENELAAILRQYGEERWAKKIAARIKLALRTGEIETTRQLSDIVSKAIPGKFHPQKIHPATKTFQALRIALNDELTAVDRGLDSALNCLKSGGRMCVISFHSLEDRIVKNRFKEWAAGCICPKTIPVCVCHHQSRVKLITRRPVCPATEEIRTNPRARSAKLRVAERI